MSTTNTSESFWDRMRQSYARLAPEVHRAALACAVLAAAGIACWAWMPRDDASVYLLGGQQFNDAQLRSFCQALEAEGLTGFRVDGTRLRIPRSEVAQYAAALAKRQVLPASFYAAFDQAVEQTSWWGSASQDDRRWELARQKFLAQIIEQMPEIESANVLVDRSAPQGLRGTSDIRGTVAIRTRGGRELPAYRIREIRHIVAGSIANLSPERVTVVDLNGKAFVGLGADDPDGDDVLARIKAFEEHYAEKIRGVLRYIPDALVTVNVELEPARARGSDTVSADRPQPIVTAAALAPEERAAVRANTAVELDPEHSAAAAPSHPLVASAAAPEERPSDGEGEELAGTPHSITVAVAVPAATAARLAGSRDDGGDRDAWTERVRAQVAHAMPAGVPARISVERYLAGAAPEPAPSALTLPPELEPWVPWGVVGGLGLLLAAGAVHAGLRARSARHAARAAAAARAQAPGAPSGPPVPPRAAAELIRVQRSSRVRRPYLAQAGVKNFEDLRRLAPAGLQAVLDAVESRLWAPALRGASHELCEHILTHMPSRAAKMLREEIDYLGPVRLGDVEAAQQEILEIVRRLDHAGDVVLEEREEVGRV